MAEKPAPHNISPHAAPDDAACRNAAVGNAAVGNAAVGNAAVGNAAIGGEAKRAESVRRAGSLDEAVAQLRHGSDEETRLAGARRADAGMPESVSEMQLRATLKQSIDERQAGILRIGLLEEALGHRERQIEAMRRAGDALFQKLDVDAVVRQTLDIALDVLNADAGSLQLYDAENDTLEFRYVVGPSAGSLIGYAMPASQGISGRVFQSGLPDLTSRVDERGDFNRAVDEQSGYHTESMMTVPVKRPGGAPLGVMQVLNARERKFDHRDLEVLQVLCAQAATVFETARLTEEARRSELVNILGDISHDIKNMLTPIQTGLWTLGPILDDLFSGIDEIQKKLKGRAVSHELTRVASHVRDHYDWILEAALESCEQVQNRTREIADAVKGEVSPPFFEDADLNEIVGEVARPLFLLADRTNVYLHLEIDHDLPRARFDRKQMYNALYNLVNNAIPETPSGGSVTIRTRGPQPDDPTLLLEVEDTGRGIAPQVLARLFTDEAVSTKAGGTGLGTRIVATVVRRHNGTISVQSELGQGTTFSIRLPLHGN